MGGLSLNRNIVTVSVGSKGISVQPDTGSLELVNKVKEGSGNSLWAERARGSDKIILHGVRQPGKAVQTTLTIHDPVRFAGSAFFRILKRKGIAFGGKWGRVKEGQPASLRGKTLLARHRSPELKELVERTNSKSDNILAQHIFRRLGASVVGFGNVKNSEAVVRDFFKKNKISTLGFEMADGSGLSENNRVAPFQLVYLLLSLIHI